MDLSSKTYIPEEIKKEILLRLPMKSLARFRCVSKTWLFLISSDEFICSRKKKNDVRLIFGSKKLPMNFYTCSIQSLVHGDSSNSQIYPTTEDNNNNLLFDRARVDKNNNYPPFFKKDCKIQIVESCNGLVFLISHRTNTLVLWNPTTGKLRKLPGSGTLNLGPQGIRWYDLSYAFGYDEMHDDYKVVESCDTTGPGFVNGGLGLKVYSLRNNSWKPLSSNWPLAAGPSTFRTMGKFLFGAIHWFVHGPGGDDVYKWSMVSLDLATDAFSVWRLPEEIGGGGDYYFDVSVGVLEEGQLALYFEFQSHVDVWVMKEYGVYESWTKTVRIPKIPKEWFVRPLFYWPEKGKVLIDYRKSLGIFDLNNPQPHQLGKEVSFSVECTTYFESLVSPYLDDQRRRAPNIFDAFKACVWKPLFQLLSCLPASC